MHPSLKNTDIFVPLFIFSYLELSKEQELGNFDDEVETTVR